MNGRLLRHLLHQRKRRSMNYWIFRLDVVTSVRNRFLPHLLIKNLLYNSPFPLSLSLSSHFISHNSSLTHTLYFSFQPPLALVLSLSISISLPRTSSLTHAPSLSPFLSFSQPNSLHLPLLPPIRSPLSSSTAEEE